MVLNAASKSRTRPARIGQIGGTHDMRNTGTPPRHASVDIRLRNGSVHRGITPKDWRWKPWRDGYESDFDITASQASKRPEAARGGKECVGTSRTVGAPAHQTKKK